ncbi:eukaryotic translation initiation factor 5B-like [Panonychus citri]|uniref:eukaryotic translation initiation factor 5B-like n=1 Tax=Panonychus citri TaxID=50023 RepID=UPI002307BAD1|nr:eukaryotic translation initiation factor 5B-like [Panonychus citri]
MEVEPEEKPVTGTAAGLDAAEEERKRKQKEKDAKKKAKKKEKAAETKKDDGKKPGGAPASAAAKKAGPGAKALALIKEQLKAKQEEEERLKKEEEERIRREEEAENERLEKLRKEKEKKERKKQKEKERKERLKKEGKLLTDKQKKDRQRALASLEAMQQQGAIIVGKEVGGGKVDKDRAYRKKRAEQRAAAGVTGQTTTNGEDKEKDKIDETPEGDPESVISVESSDEEIENWEDLTEDKDTDKKAKKGSQENDKTTKEPLKPMENKVDTNNHSNNKTDSTVTSPSEQEKLIDQPPTLRSPVICVLGHVDTGKTKILDYIRKTHVQDNEAGGITQQIGATFVPPSAINDQCKIVKDVSELKLPGLLIIDTPGHESFTNLRSRGSSLCDIAILVVDIMHGLEAQTIESINLLKSRKTPFIIALNKIDRLYGWKSNPRKDVEELIKSQSSHTKSEFEQRTTKDVILAMNENELNAALYYNNPDPKTYVSMVPTSAHTGDGMGNLINLIVSYCQERLKKRLQFDPNRLQATVLEVKALPGLGTTIDVVLVNGKLCEGDRVVMAGHEGPFETTIRSILVPQPLRELRVKCPFQELKQVYGSMGIKLTGHDLDKTIAGLELHVAKNDKELAELKELTWKRFGEAMRSIKCVDKGVYVQASTLGSLEALLQFLKDSKIPYSGVRIGPVVKKDVMKASVMLEIAPDYAVILAFDVKVERDAQELADQLGVKIFTAEIIYHLFDKFTAYRDDLKKKRKEQYKNTAVFPCKLRILPQFIFNARDPIVLGVSVEEGLLVPGVPLAVPTKENLEIGQVTSIELNHKQVDNARRGAEVCIKIEHVGGDAPKLYGRHFDYNDLLVSKITRESIDIVKEYFRDDLMKNDWQLMIELKKTFEII